MSQNSFIWLWVLLRSSLIGHYINWRIHSPATRKTREHAGKFNYKSEMAKGRDNRPRNLGSSEITLHAVVLAVSKKQWGNEAYIISRWSSETEPNKDSWSRCHDTSCNRPATIYTTQHHTFNFDTTSIWYRYNIYKILQYQYEARSTRTFTENQVYN